MSFETEQLAWLVLRAVNQTQTKGSTVRLAVPSDPEVVAQLPVVVTDGELLLAEEHLEGHGYLALADITLTRGTYTITPAGLKWLERGSPQQREAAETVAEGPEMAEPRSATGGAQEGTEHQTSTLRDWSGDVEASEARRPWWRRVFGG
ncbi:MAG: hypothetical protein H0U55_10500 [Rubrobacteraceae bacterium]|nr:hypothetical protein [Rubrobacteraceae bacterium]